MTTEALLVTTLGAAVGAVGGALVPRLVASIPEPEVLRATAQLAAERVGESVGMGEEQPSGTAPKELYAEVAALPRLGWWSAATGAAIGGLFGWDTGLDWSLIWLLGLIPVLLALCVVDFRTKLLPTVVVVPATLATLVSVVVVGLLSGAVDDLVRAVVAMLGVRTFYRLLYLVDGSGIGFGDVRLAALLGLVMGWQGWGTSVVGTIAPFVLMAVPALLAALVRWDRGMLRTAWPFGPFMVLGWVIVVVWGEGVAAFLWP